MTYTILTSLELTALYAYIAQGPDASIGREGLRVGCLEDVVASWGARTQSIPTLADLRTSALTISAAYSVQSNLSRLSGVAASKATADVPLTLASGVSVVFQADLDSQRLIQNAVDNFTTLNAMAVAAGLPGMSWVVKDNSIQLVTLADMQAVKQQILQNTLQSVLYGRQAVNAIQAGQPLPDALQAYLGVDAKGAPAA